MLESNINAKAISRGRRIAAVVKAHHMVRRRAGTDFGIVAVITSNREQVLDVHLQTQGLKTELAYDAPGERVTQSDVLQTDVASILDVTVADAVVVVR